MITRFKQQTDKPYSLHDMVVTKITKENDTVHLCFEHGYVSCKEPYLQVDGDITIEGVDEDFSCVFLLSPWGNYGDFQGKKMTLQAFMEEYPRYSLEIIDEMYGYNQVEYSGFLNLPKVKDLIEITISMYFTGDIVYETNEE